MGLGTGIALPPTHRPPHPGYTPPASRCYVCCSAGHAGQVKVVVGLRSVDQLTLDDEISGFRGITEGYNLSGIGRINNHYAIPGTD